MPSDLERLATALETAAAEGGPVADRIGLAICELVVRAQAVAIEQVLRAAIAAEN